MILLPAVRAAEAAEAEQASHPGSPGRKSGNISGAVAGLIISGMPLARRSGVRFTGLEYRFVESGCLIYLLGGF